MANLFKAELRVLGPMFSQLHKAGVNDEMLALISAEDGEYARAAYEAIMAKVNGAVAKSVGMIIIPADATAEQIIADAKAAFAEADIPFTHFNDDVVEIVCRDLELVRGQTLCVLINDFGCEWETDEGRAWQKSRNADGNAVALLVWITLKKPKGWFVSIANEDSRLFCHPVGNLYAPRFCRDVGCRVLGLCVVRIRWGASVRLASFLAISSEIKKLRSRLCGRSFLLEDIASIENLCAAWEEFIRGKRNKEDVQAFSCRLMDEIASLHEGLMAGTYRHGPYVHVRISDPKPRDIYKAAVRDRLLHHAIHRQLYPFYDRLFIADSFSCRERKGVHRALDRFRAMAWKASKNHSRTCWVLKCDIRKFFASIDHDVLLKILSERIEDWRLADLLGCVIGSFGSSTGKGLPLGNLTSQLFSNAHLNELDQFMKRFLKIKWYIRYADDFAIFSDDRMHLVPLIPVIQLFLRDRLKLALHPDKVFLRTVASGVDVLVWVHFPHHRVLRTATKR